MSTSVANLKFIGFAKFFVLAFTVLYLVLLRCLRLDLNFWSSTKIWVLYTFFSRTGKHLFRRKPFFTVL